MASGIKTEIEGEESVNPRAPLLITFDQIKKECKVETETNNEPITPYSGGEMCKPQDNLNSDFTGNMTETITHSTEKMKIDNQFKKRFTCSVCNKSVSSKSYLKYHLRIHNEENPNKCDVCGKTFISNSYLSLHLKIHTGEKPYKCNVCGKGFISNSYLSSHLKIHTGEKPYKCNVCGKGYYKKSSVSEHLKIHSDEKPYKCSLCDKGFRSNSSLTNHLKTHSGVKPYKCEKCAKCFALKSLLNQHILTHFDNKYNCKTCGRSESCEDCLYFK